jgi:hypothetical protein
MCGPLRHHRHAVALINQRPQQRDFLAEALEADAERRASVDRFPVVSHFALPARQVLGDISAFTARQAPTLLAAGNDAKKEFYAAVRGCPEAGACSWRTASTATCRCATRSRPGGSATGTGAAA